MNNEPVEYENTDREIWRAIPNDYYSPSIFVTKENNIGINVGGRVSVKTVEQWYNNVHPAKTIENLKDGELPVLTVTVLDCNGKLIRSVVSFKETRIICDSLVDELRKANEK